jgi:hypothetical protein
MFRSAKEMIGHKVAGEDVTLGLVRDALFDECFLIIRYLELFTEEDFPDRRVLICPSIAGPPNWITGVIPVSISMHDIERSPHIQKEKPLSRKDEIELAAYFGCPSYWESTDREAEDDEQAPEDHELSSALGSDVTGPGMSLLDPTPLHSLRELLGRRCLATDGTVGQVDDLIFRTEDWSIKYLLSALDDLRFQRVLISTDLISIGSSKSNAVYIALDKESVSMSGPLDPRHPIDPQVQKQETYVASQA